MDKLRWEVALTRAWASFLGGVKALSFALLLCWVAVLLGALSLAAAAVWFVFSFSPALWLSLGLASGTLLVLLATHAGSVRASSWHGSAPFAGALLGVSLVVAGLVVADAAGGQIEALALQRVVKVFPGISSKVARRLRTLAQSVQSMDSAVSGARDLAEKAVQAFGAAPKASAGVHALLPQAWAAALSATPAAQSTSAFTDPMRGLWSLDFAQEEQQYVASVAAPPLELEPSEVPAALPAPREEGLWANAGDWFAERWARFRAPSSKVAGQGHPQGQEAWYRRAWRWCRELVSA